jgi:hypothetical protein
VSVGPAIVESAYEVVARASRELLGDGTYATLSEGPDHVPLSKLVEQAAS